MTSSAVRTVLVGAGGHARVVLSILRADPQITVVGVAAPSLGSVRGLPLLGDGDDALNQANADVCRCGGDERLR